MAKLAWGKVNYNGHYAGVLQQMPGERYAFTYDESYLHAGHPYIAYGLPLQEEPHISMHGLHPFFDNLVAEGWLESAQKRILGNRSATRFELLLAFGFDCAGAVSVEDPEPQKMTDNMLDIDDQKESALLASRASLSGVQPKMAVIHRAGKFFPTAVNELSTYIAKFSSPGHANILENEYLTTLAHKKLIPDEQVVELSLGGVEGIDQPALLIKRFDRADNERIHFEEFNQLLSHKSSAKYDGNHKDMADFIAHTEGCVAAEKYRLYGRILAGLILGNTDMHLKNFAMIHTLAGLRLSPAYDLVTAALYDYKTIALTLDQADNLRLGDLKAKHIIGLGREYGLSDDAIMLKVAELRQNLSHSIDVVHACEVGDNQLKLLLTKMMEKRWNGTFASIGQALSKKR